MAEIQQLLQRWYHSGDKPALAQVFPLLTDEFIEPTAAFLRSPQDTPEVEDALSSVFMQLLFREGGKAPLLAPPGHDPRRWRNKVHRHALIDLARKEGMRREVARGAAHGLSRAAVREKRAAERRERELRAGKVRALPEDVSLSAPLEVAAPVADPGAEEEMLARRELARKARELLPRLEVRKRVAIALSAGIHVVRGWLLELARAQEEPLDHVASRYARFENDPEDRELKVRILYPEGELVNAVNAFAKLLERARIDLMALITGGRSA